MDRSLGDLARGLQTCSAKAQMTQGFFWATLQASNTNYVVSVTLHKPQSTWYIPWWGRPHQCQCRGGGSRSARKLHTGPQSQYHTKAQASKGCWQGPQLSIPQITWHIYRWLDGTGHHCAPCKYTLPCLESLLDYCSLVGWCQLHALIRSCIQKKVSSWSGTNTPCKQKPQASTSMWAV